MPKPSAKTLRAVLEQVKCDGHAGPWEAQLSLDGVEVVARNGVIVVPLGMGADWSTAELIALAPDLAREVLKLRREVRRLRKVAGHGR